MQETQPPLSVQKIVHLSMLGAVAINAALPFILRPIGEPNPLITGVLLGAAALTGAMSLVARRRVLGANTRNAFAANVVGWAMAEAVGALGLAIYLLAGGTALCWILCAAAALLLFVHRPLAADRLGDSRALIRPDVKIG
jgi:hypothetical protein